MKPLFLLLAGLLAAPAFAQTEAKPAPGSKPNVLIIALDDLNHWIGYTGRNSQTKTPNIDRLSAKGISFTNSHCEAPVCNATRASLLSGLRPYQTGVYGNGDDWRKVVSPELTLITTFRKAGYETLGSGKIYHGGFDRKSEWDDYLQNEGKAGPEPEGSKGVGGIRFGAVDAQDSDLSDYRIVSYGIDQLGKKHDKPFFLTVGLHKPHMPWFVPKKYFDLHPLDSIQLPPNIENDLADIPEAGRKIAAPQGDHQKIIESGRWKEAVQAYLAAVSYADAQVGRLLDALEASEYKDNTIVVLFGDHGWSLGEKEHWRKFSLWEESTRTPLIWVAPGVTKPRTLSSRPVDFTAIYPTLTDLAGIPTPSHVQGKSIRPLLADGNAPWDGHALTTWLSGNHSVRTEQWRYTRYADGTEELYDEKKDPYEWVNLAGKSEFDAQKAELKKLIPTTNAPSVGKPDGDGKGAGKGNGRPQARKDAKASEED